MRLPGAPPALPARSAAYKPSSSVEYPNAAEGAAAGLFGVVEAAPRRLSRHERIMADSLDLHNGSPLGSPSTSTPGPFSPGGRAGSIVRFGGQLGTLDEMFQRAYDRLERLWEDCAVPADKREAFRRATFGLMNVDNLKLINDEAERLTYYKSTPSGRSQPLAPLTPSTSTRTHTSVPTSPSHSESGEGDTEQQLPTPPPAVEEPPQVQRDYTDAEFHIAATNIQRVWKGYKARKKHKWRSGLHHAVVRLQRFCRWYNAQLVYRTRRKHWRAAIMIQRVWRGSRARAEIKFEATAYQGYVTRIQKVWRGCIERKVMKGRVTQWRAAIKLQAMWRGSQTRVVVPRAASRGRVDTFDSF